MIAGGDGRGGRWGLMPDWLSFLVDRLLIRDPAERYLRRGHRLAGRGDHAAAARAWLTAARAGSVSACHHLAEAYEQGNGVLPDPAAAFRWHQSAAGGGHAQSHAQLAVLYANGVGGKAGDSGTFSVSADLVLARDHALMAARQGHVEAQVLLAWLLARTDTGFRDVEAAEAWYRRAMGLGSVSAKVGLALLLGGATAQDGHSPRQVEAFRLLQEAQAAGDLAATYQCARAYITGEGLEQDESKAYTLMLAAAEGGVVAAQRALGLQLLKGQGVSTSRSGAETWWRRAALRGDIESMILLADLHAGGHATVPNAMEAALWYQVAADRGHCGAMVALALAYKEGKGVPRDGLQAVRWLRRAAEGGESQAHFHLALSHLSGIDLPQDYTAAARHFRIAADTGHADALYNLGVLYFHGHGLPQDKAVAMLCYREAAERGSASAQFRVGRAHAIGEDGLQDMAMAIAWTRRAARQGHVPGQINLARLLLKAPADQGPEGDSPGNWRAEAESWARRAVAVGSAEALTALAEILVQPGEGENLAEAAALAAQAAATGDERAVDLVQYLAARGFDGVVR